VLVNTDTPKKKKNPTQITCLQKRPQKINSTEKMADIVVE